ncbi:MAG: DUF177 domain-containing protein [Chitinophagaceae bacterium]|nr:DUF177 domain-containing protein [Chitinophagaceae bacterium]
MSSSREFDIAFVGLKPGIHHYEYHIEDPFFEAYQEHRDFENCDALVKLALDKKTGFMMLKFEIGGSVKVSCDRCGNPLPIDLWDEFNIVVKLVDDPDKMNSQEEDPDVYYISKGESHLRVADWIYEFINLSIPMQKMCGEDEKGKAKCNPEVLDVLKKMEVESKEQSNPIWKGLEKFKDLDS